MIHKGLLDLANRVVDNAPYTEGDKRTLAFGVLDADKFIKALEAKLLSERDHIAIAAMQGLLAADHPNLEHEAALAHKSYKIADAMLAVKKESKP